MMSWGPLKMGMREEWGHFLDPQTPIICTLAPQGREHSWFSKELWLPLQGRAGNIPSFYGIMAPSSWDVRFSQEYQDLQAGRDAILRLCKMFVNLSFWLNQPFCLGLDGIVHTEWNIVFGLAAKIIFQRDPSKMGFFHLIFQFCCQTEKSALPSDQ